MQTEAGFAHEIEEKCLEKAKELLDKEGVPSAATLDTVERLMGIVSTIEAINLNRDRQNRFYAVGSSRQASQRR